MKRGHDRRVVGDAHPPAAEAPEHPSDEASGATTDARIRALEQRYDNLHPVDFAKAVLQFGDRLERQGKDVPAAEKDAEIAEYSFLQDRLSFWLAYEYTPPDAQGNLRSAAMGLYRGGVAANLAGPGRLPYSMLVAGGEVAFLNNAPPPRLRIPAADAADPSFRVPGETPREPNGPGGTIDNSVAGIQWNKGIKDQGAPFEDYIAGQNATRQRLGASSKTFDLFDPTNGEAVSVKTLNT